MDILQAQNSLMKHLGARVAAFDQRLTVFPGWEALQVPEDWDGFPVSVYREDLHPSARLKFFDQRGQA